jgi:hypothetical protein
MIPIKGYATFDTLKHCILGSSFDPEWFHDLDIYKDDRIMDPLKRIAEETEEDLQGIEKVLKDANVQVHRASLDIENFGKMNKRGYFKPTLMPRDHFGVIGEKFYAVGGGTKGYSHIFKQIERNDIVIENTIGSISTACICRVGKDIWWDIDQQETPHETVQKYVDLWTNEGFRVHLTTRGYHSDSIFCVVKPGCIVSLENVQDYAKEFPGWDVCTLPEKANINNMDGFVEMKDKNFGKWWLKGEEHNDALIHFVNTYLNEWVGYVEETVFDVNMLSIDQNTIICNNHNKEVFQHFKKHKVEPVVCNFRHRFFWDGGIHCITQDLYREGTQEDYFG